MMMKMMMIMMMMMMLAVIFTVNFFRVGEDEIWCSFDRIIKKNGG